MERKGFQSSMTLLGYALIIWNMLPVSSNECSLPANVSVHATCQLEDCILNQGKTMLSKCSCYTSLNVISLDHLSLEYTSFSFGSAQIIGSSEKPSSLSHQHGLLSGLPDNLCQFPQLVKLDLSHNALFSLDGLWCLAQLDTLRLSYNLLTWLDNATFAGLARLRELYLDHNNIAHLGLSTLNLATPFLQWVELSENQLATYDISNWKLSNPFCEINLTRNVLVKFTNNLSMPIDLFKDKGPGFVSLQYNNFTEFPNWRDLNVGNIRELAVFLNWGFDFRNNPWTCDCYIYSFIDMTSKFYQSVHMDYHDAQCFNPPQLRGQLVKDLDPGILRCNISESCPLDSCLCYFQTSILQTFVQCANSLLTLLPEVLPNFLHNGAISLDLSGSPITELLARPYLPFVVELNLSHTAITTFPEEIVPLLNPDVKIDLTGTPLRSLPPSLLAKVPARNLNVSLTSLECHCNLTFVETWLAQVGRNLSSSQCWQQGRRRGAKEVVQECRRPDNTLVVVGVSVGSVAALVLLLTGLSYVFRYELAVLAHTLLYGTALARAVCSSKVRVEKVHDLYISVGESHRPLVLREVWPRLTRQGYTVFLPDIHILPGEITRDAQIGAITRSRHVLIVMDLAWRDNDSRQYEGDNACRIAFRDWDCDVTLFQEQGLRECPTNPYLKAMRRLGQACPHLQPQTLVDKLLYKLKSSRSMEAKVMYTEAQENIFIQDPALGVMY